jgi:putative phosphoesterase
VLDELRAYAPVEAVHGNRDDEELVRALPKERLLEIDGARIAMLHEAGPRAGREARLVRRFPDCAAVVYAHTHVPQAEQYEDVWVLNPGSPTERRRARARSMLVVEVADGRVRPKLLELY